MSEGLGDKVHGKTDEFVGKAKKVAGNVTGDDELKAEGHADEVKGKAEGLVGKVKDVARDVADTAKGVVHKATNKPTHTPDDGTTHTH